MKKNVVLAAAIAFLFGLSFALTLHAAEQAKPIELRAALFISPQHKVFTDRWTPFAKELEQRSNGRVKITFYPSEALGKAKDHYNLAVTGIADISMAIMGYTPGRFPLTEVLELPIVWPSSKIASRVAAEIYEKYLKKEFSDIKLISLCINDPAQIMTTKRPVKSLADMAGLRLRTGNPRQVEMLRAWGASPMNITIFDTYDALQKGSIDGVYTNYSSLRDFKLHEQLDNYTTFGVGSAVAIDMMSLKAWNSLPPDIQKIIDDHLSGVKQSMLMGEIFDRTAKEGLEEGVKRGGKVYILSDAERAAFMAKTKPIIDGWIENAEKKGLPGRKVYEDVIALVDKYSKEEASGQAGKK